MIIPCLIALGWLLVAYAVCVPVGRLMTAKAKAQDVLYARRLARQIRGVW